MSRPYKICAFQISAVSFFSREDVALLQPAMPSPRSILQTSDSSHKGAVEALSQHLLVVVEHRVLPQQEWGNMFIIMGHMNCGIS